MIKNIEELPPVEGEAGDFPRLAKIFEAALKLFNGEVEEDH